jgi:PPK2 family polyphosphate:nucleotide phosphotransferase
VKIDTKEFRVREGGRVRLSHRPTRVKPYYRSMKHYEKILGHHRDQMRRLQNLLYASDNYALLLIFQALDAAGKDGAIKHVMSGVNPQGCQVFSFKHPSAEELEHDFLWRSARCRPERGHIGIFNRSYYEEVLILRVHPELLEGEGRPKEAGRKDDLWRHRFASIAHFEKHLHRNGTRVVKFFLHLSKDEQRKRFLRRIDEPEKNWKFSMDDIRERKFWKQYAAAYEDCLGATSFDHAPWYIVPADDKRNAWLIISQIIVDALQSLKLKSLKPSPERRRELRKIRKMLTREQAAQ